MSEREALWTFLRRPLVWGRDAHGLRAFGVDFGPFALCVLRDERCDACGKPTYKCCVGDGCSS